MGNVITQSVVALGAANTFTRALDDDLLVETMLSKVPPKVHEANKKAYELGRKYALEALEKGPMK